MGGWSKVIGGGTVSGGIWVLEVFVMSLLRISTAGVRVRITRGDREVLVHGGRSCPFTRWLPPAI